MKTRLIHQGWSAELTDALAADPSRLRIICPFIKAGVLDRLLALKPGKIEVITRFNLGDFAEGVSDIQALQALLKAKARVRGIWGLHAKAYLFGTSRAIITSANLTKMALDKNQEFGLVTEDQSHISECHTFFDYLWQAGKSDLTQKELAKWADEVSRHQILGGRKSRHSGLEDHGEKLNSIAAEATRPVTAVTIPSMFGDASQAFVKFLGESDNRALLTYKTLDEVKRAGCHWALGYPNTKRPRIVRENAVMFIGRLTQNPDDIRIFGRAIGMKHVKGRDDATDAEIKDRNWKSIWGRYIRVHHAEFLSGTMANGISLRELMNTLEADSFRPTQDNARKGKGNTNPRKSYSQQAAVELSKQGMEWLGARLQAAFDQYGTIPQETLDRLDWPTSPRSP
ncbi:MAG: phospholipase D family protein [Verrucomicrobiales bacterium]